MNMALQKFAHGAHHYCNFKRTALFENALHYDNKQILCNTPFIFRCFSPFQVDLWAETLPFSVVLQLDYEQSPFFLRDSRASETRARVKITPREKGESLSPPRLAFLALRDFHARSRFAGSTIPEEK